MDKDTIKKYDEIRRALETEHEDFDELLKVLEVDPISVGYLV